MFSYFLIMAKCPIKFTVQIDSNIFTSTKTFVKMVKRVKLISFNTNSGTKEFSFENLLKGSDIVENY